MNKPKSKKVKLRAKTGTRRLRIENKKKEQVRRVRQRLIGTIKPLTSEEIAAGKSHEAVDIEFAEDSVLTVSLRRKPNEAFVVGCYCAFCNARRAEHWRRGEDR